LKCYKVGHAEWEGGLNVSGSVNSVRLLIHIPGCMRLDMRQNSDGHSTDTVPDMWSFHVMLRVWMWNRKQISSLGNQ